MSWERIEANWSRIGGQARKRWAELTEEELAAVGGRREQLSGWLQRRYGFSPADAEREIDEWIKEPGVLDDWNDRRAILDM